MINNMKANQKDEHGKEGEGKAATMNPASKKRCPDEPNTGKSEPKHMKLTDWLPVTEKSEQSYQ